MQSLYQYKKLSKDMVRSIKRKKKTNDISQTRMHETHTMLLTQCNEPTSFVLPKKKKRLKQEKREKKDKKTK